MRLTLITLTLVVPFVKVHVLHFDNLLRPTERLKPASPLFSVIAHEFNFLDVSREICLNLQSFILEHLIGFKNVSFVLKRAQVKPILILFTQLHLIHCEVVPDNELQLALIGFYLLTDQYVGVLKSVDVPARREKAFDKFELALNFKAIRIIISNDFISRLHRLI